ncbi:hypothetical protein BASA81_016574 [Batrachochytrium salamandrivorans]|nr:hypothetical protein BASA81_016574 [Batrachochytrium salamandrivorans]
MSKQFACNSKGRTGTLRFPGNGQLIWDPDNNSGASGITRQLADVFKVDAAKMKPGVPKTIALRVIFRVPAPPNNILDLDTFKTESARDEARSLLQSVRAAAVKASSPALPTTAGSTPAPHSPNPSFSPPPPSIISTTSTTSLPSPRKNNPPALAPNYPVASVDIIKARGKLLQRDDKLRALHQKLVQGKIVSEEDFWVGKEATINEQFALEKQPYSLPNAALLDPGREQLAAVAKRSDEVVLTKDMIERIYLEHPDVKQKHQALVPHNLSESQFWASYLHSRHVLGTRRNVDFADLRKNPTTSNNAQRKKKSPEQREWESKGEELFGSVDLHRLEFRKQLERKFQSRLGQIDPEVDLTATLNDAIVTSALAGMPHNGYGIVRRENDWFVSKSAMELARSLAANKNTKDVITSKEKLDELAVVVREDPMLTTINERAALTRNSAPVTEKDELESNSLRKKRLRLDHDSELRLDRDLDLVAKVEVKFELKPPPPPPNSITFNSNTEPKAQAPSATHRPFDPTFAFPTKENHFIVPSWDGAQQYAGASKFRFETDLPVAIQNAFVVELKAVDEYCRHFWATAANSPKRCLIVDKMKEVSQRIQGPLREAIRHNAPLGSFLTTLPLAQLSRAMEKHAEHCQSCGKRH